MLESREIAAGIIAKYETDFDFWDYIEDLHNTLNNLTEDIEKAKNCGLYGIVGLLEYLAIE